MAVLTPFFDVVAGVAILAGRSSLLDKGVFKTANTNFTVRHLLALGFIGYGGWNLWKIERAQDKLKKTLDAESFSADWQTNDKFWNMLYEEHEYLFDEDGMVDYPTEQLAAIAKDMGFDAESFEADWIFSDKCEIRCPKCGDEGGMKGFMKGLKQLWDRTGYDDYESIYCPMCGKGVKIVIPKAYNEYGEFIGDDDYEAEDFGCFRCGMNKKNLTDDGYCESCVAWLDSRMPPFVAESESFSANPQGRPRCSKCVYRYGMKTCGACGDIQCERCFGSSGWCKSCPPKCVWCNTPAHSCSNCSEPNYLCVDCCSDLNAESFGAEENRFPYPEAKVTNIVGVKDKAYVTIRYLDTDDHYGYERIMEVDMEDVMLAELDGITRDEKIEFGLMPYKQVEGMGILSGDNATDHISGDFEWDGYSLQLIVDGEWQDDILDISATHPRKPLGNDQLEFINAMVYNLPHPTISSDELASMNWFWADNVMRALSHDYSDENHAESFEAEKLHPALYRYKGKIKLRKGWTECQECDDLVKMNDINFAYLEGYGNATVCDACVEKYQGFKRMDNYMRDNWTSWKDWGEKKEYSKKFVPVRKRSKWGESEIYRLKHDGII